MNAGRFILEENVHNIEDAKKYTLTNKMTAIKRNYYQIMIFSFGVESIKT